MGGGVQRTVEHHNVRGNQQILQGHAGNTVYFPCLVRPACADDPAPKGLTQLSSPLADFSKAYNADGFAL